MTYSFETVNLLRERGEVVPDGVAEIPTSELWAKLREANVGGGSRQAKGDWATPLPQPFCKVKQEKMPKFTKFSLF